MRRRCKHDYKPYEWKNYLNYTNTQGKYVNNLGGIYTKYICLKCKDIISLDVSPDCKITENQPDKELER